MHAYALHIGCAAFALFKGTVLRPLVGADARVQPPQTRYEEAGMAIRVIRFAVRTADLRHGVKDSRNVIRGALTLFVADSGSSQPRSSVSVACSRTFQGCCEEHDISQTVGLSYSSCVALAMQDHVHSH